MSDKIRSAHNFLLQRKPDYVPDDITLLTDFAVLQSKPLKPYKVALMLVAVNPNYWQYASQTIEDVQKYFLPGHKTDIFLWSDMPKWTEQDITAQYEKIDKVQTEFDPTFTDQKRIKGFFDHIKCYMDALYLNSQTNEPQIVAGLKRLGFDSEFTATERADVKNLFVKNVDENTPARLADAARELIRKQKNLLDSSTVFEVEPIEWPYGTLLRYSMFLQQEEALKDYDYIFYMDVDIRIVNYVGDEILGDGLTMAKHPMYALRKDYVPPYEPNKESAAYIPRFGRVVEDEGKPRFEPLYAAGGFQGGKTDKFIEAMKVMRQTINEDFNRNYTAIWNDESHWNRYLFSYDGPLVVLSPSYIYPDSLIKEYYEKLWGRNYPPKIITLTKPFTLQKLDANRFASL